MGLLLMPAQAATRHGKRNDWHFKVSSLLTEYAVTAALLLEVNVPCFTECGAPFVL